MATDFHSLWVEDEKASDTTQAAEVPQTKRIDPPVDEPAAAAPTPAQAPSEPSLAAQVGEAFQDTGRAVGRGIEDAGRGVYETGARVANATVKGLTPPFLRDAMPDEIVPSDAFKDVPHIFDTPNHIVNQLATGVVEFGAAQVGGKHMLDLAGVGAKIPAAIRGIVDSAVGTAAVADPHAPRISDAIQNLTQKFPILENPVTEFLASDPNDSFAAGKLKATLEDMMANPVAMVLMHSLGAIKAKMVGKSDDYDIAKIQEHLTEADNVAKNGAPEKYSDNVIDVPEVHVTATPLKQPYAMSPSELEDSIKTAQESEHADLLKAFGSEEAVSKAQRVLRRGDEAEIEKITPHLSSTDRDRLIYGIGSNGPNLDELKDFHLAVSNLDTTSPETLGKSLSKAITDVGNGSDPSKMSYTQKLAYAKLRTGFEYAKEHGWDTSVISAEAIKGAKGRFSDPEDAAFMLRRFLSSPEPSTNGSKSPTLTKTVTTPEGEQITSNVNGLSLTAHAENDALHIDRIEVGEELRGGGMGSQAVTEMEAAARAKGLTKITGEALPNSEEFWKKQGFKVGEPEEGVGLRPITKDLTTTAETAPKVVEAPAVEIKNFKGEPVFTLNQEQHDSFMKQMQGMIEANHVDQVRIPTDGFMNYTKMDSEIETQNVISGLAKMMQPVLDAKMGKVQKFEEVQKAADFFGTKPDQMLANLSTYSGNAQHMAATVVAGKIFAQSLADDVFRIARSIYMGNAGNAARVELVRKMDILNDVQRMTKEVQTAAARTTSAGRIRTTAQYTPEQIGKLLDEYGKDPKQFDKLIEGIALTEGDPARIAATLRVQSLGEKILDTHNYLFLNGILGKVSTHVVNVSTAFAESLLRPTAQMVGGVVRRDWADVRQGYATIKALHTMVFDSLEMARRTMATNRNVLDPGKSQTDRPVETIGSTNWNLDPKTWLGQGADALGFVTGFTSRMLRTEDEFFKQMNYRASLKAVAAREAADQVRAGKLAIKDMDAFVENRFQSSFEMQAGQATAWDKVRQGKNLVGNESAMPNGMVLRQTFGKDETALKYAQSTTFTRPVSDADTFLDLPSIGELMARTASHPVIRGTLLPFITVPTNLFREGMNYGPAALLRKQFYSDIAAGGTRSSVAIGKLSMGTMIWTSAGLMAANGMIQGGLAGDKEIRQSQIDAGVKPYSFVGTDENGQKHYQPFGRFDWLGMPFGLIADFHQIANTVSKEVRDNLAAHMTLALAQNLTSKSYFKAIVDAASMMGAGYNKTDVAMRMIQMKAASYVPGGLQMFQGDDELKAVRSVADAIIAKIPGWSESIPAKRDIFGEKRINEAGQAWSAISPSVGSDETKDPVKKEMARLAAGESEAQFSMPSINKGNIDLTTVKNAKGQDAYDRWTELAGKVEIGGKNLHDKLAELIKSDRYTNGTDGNSMYETGSKVMNIRNEIANYREKAFRQMTQEFSDEPGSPTFGPDKLTLKQVFRTDTQNEKAMKQGRQPGVTNFLEAMSQ